MNCLSEYPPNYEDLNLKYILKMKSLMNVIGHSDHRWYFFTIAVMLGLI